MIDTLTPTTLDRFREANRDLSVMPFYIGTSRRRVGGIDLVVHLNLKEGVVVGFVAADVSEQPHQTGRAHPLATTLVSIHGDERHQRLAEGKLDGEGSFSIVAVPVQVRYFLHFGEGG